MTEQLYYYANGQRYPLEPEVQGITFASEEENLLVLEKSNRLRRDAELNETDWWATVDRTMTAEQTAYRQALRDLPTHANWPNLQEEDWPTKP